MFIKRKKEVPGLNTTSTADISFMLLIFFLVTSSMNIEKGLTRQMPPPDDSTEEQEVEVKERNVLQLDIDHSDRLTCNGDPITTQELSQRVERFVTNKDNDPKLPEKSRREVHLMGLTQVSDRHVIMIHADPNSTFNTYFNMQNAIVRGYYRARNTLARNRFGHTYDKCSDDERDALAIVYPQRIREDMPPGATPKGDDKKEKGGEP